MFRGSITALVTPMRGAEVDFAGLEALVDWQITHGTHGLVPAGTTGESPTLSHAEHKEVVSRCVRVVAGRVPVIAGAGSNNTVEAIDLSRHAEKTGASALLIVAPYYNKPSQEGIFRHFKAINDAVGIPIFIYNIPARSVVDVSVETMARLYELPNIVGVKDATGRLDRVPAQRQAMGPDFIQLSGEDATALGFMAHGGHGCISVTSNVAPQLCAAFQDACMEGDYGRALALNDRLQPLHSALFVEPNPAGPKFALSLLGRMTAEVRLPLVPLSPAGEGVVRKAVADAGLV